MRARIGFLTAVSATSPHFESFKAFIPEGVEMDFIGLGLVKASLYELDGTASEVVKRALELARSHMWDGVIVSGAPLELLNPGLSAQLKAKLEVPVTTALDSCVTALDAFSAKRVLLLTPFDDRMNDKLRDYLADSGIETVSPRETFRDIREAARLSPDEVYALTAKALKEALPVDAIYFQGAVLDPLKVLQRMEDELATTVIASNPAMLWHMLSRLGLRYQIRGYGRLLHRWPELPFQQRI